MLHIVNGDSTLELLRRSGVPGTLSVWADALYEGPTPLDVDAARFREVRARFHDESGVCAFENSLKTLEGWDRVLESHPKFREVVLWFEHDLFDQLILIRLLDGFSRPGARPKNLSLVSIDAYPGIPRFVGLGQLTPRQLAPLLDGRQGVTDAQIQLAARAWRAFGSPDPTSAEALLAADTRALPFLAGALYRHLQQFPSTRNGLSRTESQTLTGLAKGRHAVPELFRAVQDVEERPFMADTTFLFHLRRMSVGSAPLVTLGGSPRRAPLAGLVATLTDTGRRVLDAKADAVQLNGIDRWLGGVRLRGNAAVWRWDESSGRLAPPGE